MYHHANASRKADGDGGGADGSFRGPPAISQCIPSATRGGAVDDLDDIV